MAEIAYRYNGESLTVQFEDVFTQDRIAALGLPAGVAVTSQNVTESQLKNALAQHLDVNVNEFRDMYTELNPNGNATLRPNTTFGV